MKYFAFVENDHNDINKARQCPTMEMAMAVAIMSNSETPCIAVLDGTDKLLVDPRSNLISLAGLIKSEFVLVTVSDEGELELIGYDCIPLSTKKHTVLVHYKDSMYIEAVGDSYHTIDALMKLVNDLDVISKSRESIQFGSFTIKSSESVFFNKTGHMISISGSFEKNKIEYYISKSIVPRYKLMVVSTSNKGAGRISFVGRFSQLIKLYENSDLSIHHDIYIVDDNLEGFYLVKNPTVDSIHLY